MRRILQGTKNFFRTGDMVLLTLCLVATAFGCLIISSATNVMGALRFVVIQLVAATLGIALYAIISSIDVERLTEQRYAMVIFNVFVLCLLIPFGTDNGTGNRSWLDIPLLPVNIQPAEICKITFILVLASVMASHQNRISSIPSVMHMAFHLLLLIGLNMVLSKDLGVSLIFVFIFIGMAFAGGVSMIWFLLAGGCIAAGFPILWRFLDSYQQKRILVLFDPSIDPLGINERYHTVRSLRSLTGGGFTGQGLYQGTRTQTEGALFAQHTDYIFSAIGEELGFVGCIFVLILLGLIVARCIWVGTRSQDYVRRIVCFGAASALMFQIISNVGMCIGLTPVIGLTLPFISYGGSSIVTLYAMMGLVSGVFARPNPPSHERYIRPPYMSKTLRY